MSYQQMFVDDQPLVRNQPAAGHAPKLEPLQWCLVRGWIYFRVEGGKLPEAYNLSCCGEQVGITLYEVHDVVIHDLNVRGFWLDGMNCHDNVIETRILRITAQENGRSGISIGGASRVAIESCTAGGNGAAQMRVEGFATVEMSRNVLDSTSAPALQREGGRILERE
jgi:hypothetical protein